MATDSGEDGADQEGLRGLVPCQAGGQTCAGVCRIAGVETASNGAGWGPAKVTAQCDEGMAGGSMATSTGLTGAGLAGPDGARGVPFASSWRRAHLTVDQRVARGRAARREAPRSGHGRWEAAPDRGDPVALLEEQAVTRVPELVPIRYGRMLASPFTFYRGAAAIMAADLAATPVSGITVQLCGDAHLSNFGVFGTPERQLIFDINDFDET